MSGYAHADVLFRMEFNRREAEDQYNVRRQIYLDQRVNQVSTLVTVDSQIRNLQRSRLGGTVVASASFSESLPGGRPSRLQQLVVDNIKRREGVSESRIIVERLQATAARRLERPGGAPISLIVKRKGQHEKPKETWQRLQQNWRYIVQFPVKESSKDTYSTALRVYKQFCASAGITDIWLREESQEFLSSDEVVVSENPFCYQVTVLLSFIAYLHVEQRVKHTTVGVYLSGMRHWFKQMFLTKFDEHFDEPIVLQARSSLHYLEVKNEALAAADSRTLPFTCDMIIYTRDVFLKKRPQTWNSWGIFMCILITFCCLMRHCEILPTAANHYLRGQDVVFGVLSQGVELQISSKDAWKYLTVLSVSITVHSAKNDWQGEGHRMHFSTGDAEANILGFDLVSEMFAWAREARPRDDDAFLMHKGKNLVSYTEVSAVIKKVATEFGFDDTHFSMHSLRIGGASTLAAAGKPSHYIQKMGRWKSLAFLSYIHWAVSGMKDALNTLSNPFIFTADHLKKINSAAILRV